MGHAECLWQPVMLNITEGQYRYRIVRELKAHLRLLQHFLPVEKMLHAHKVKRQRLQHHFLDVERTLHAYKDRKIPNGDKRIICIRRFTDFEPSYLAGAATNKVSGLLSLLVLGGMCLRLSTEYELPTAAPLILATISLGTGIWLLTAKLSQKALKLCLEKTEEGKNMRSKIRRKNNGREVVRFQFEIDPDLWKELDRFQQEGGVTTKRELLNNALTLFMWAGQHKERGNSICAVGPNGTIYELEMPVLESIELSSQRKIRLVNAQNEEEKAASAA